MPFLQPGDLVRFVSPASPPDRDSTEQRAELLKTWGLRVDIAPHAFDKFGYLAGPDTARLADLTTAFLDPGIRAVFATRGGKGSYRIAHHLPFAEIHRDRKPLIGFSDITCLQLALWRGSQARSVHGALMADDDGRLSPRAAQSLRRALMGDAPLAIETDPSISSAALTTGGMARGVLIGGSLAMIATSAGWALPSLSRAILLIESDGPAIGQFERDLTLLHRAGHLDGIAGVAIGHINRTPPNPPITATGLLRRTLDAFGVPVLGGLPIGHDPDACSVVLGAHTVLDADAGTLTQDIAPDPGPDQARR